MNYDDLLNSNRIRKENVSEDEIRAILQRAEKDLETARLTMAHDWSWAFAIAYNAVLQSSRAYMFAQGYRPSTIEGHKVTFQFMRIALGKQHEDMVTYFDRMRVKRNQTVYDAAGTITETEAGSILEKTETYLGLISEKLGLS